MLNLLIITTRKKVNRKSSLKSIQRWSGGKGDKKKVAKTVSKAIEPVVQKTENVTNTPVSTAEKIVSFYTTICGRKIF